MAAVSAWSKPGAWALDSEEQEQQDDKGDESPTESNPSAASDFPSLSAAATTAKIPKKKSKKQTLTLAEFSTAKFRDDSPVILPTGPRERSAEELDRSRHGGGFRYNSYNSDGGRDGGRGSDDSRRERREPRVSDSGPSRADEADDWGATKKSVGIGGYSERRERGSFGSSQSKADESDSWISSKKSYAPPSGEGRRERRGYDFNKEGSNGSGADSESWGRKREEKGGREMNSDNWGRKREEESGGRGVDSDIRGKKREESGGGGESGRPRLVLKPRSLPLVDGVSGEGSGEEEEKQGEVVKSGGKVANPFGEARPREEVLKEKGLDWKEINEKPEVVKIQEGEVKAGRKGSELKEDRTERAWRKPEMASRY